MKKKIVLFEHQLFNVKQILSEISSIDKYNKERNRTKWSLDDFMSICHSDPTYNKEKDIVGKYTNWLLNKLENIEQLQKIRIPLEWYADGNKKGILGRQGISNDINSYKTIDEFITTMNNIFHSNDSNMSQSEYNNREKLKGNFEIVGSNDIYEIIAPKTFKAERYFGSGTEWCTVANESYFDEYYDEAPLYIFYPKNGDNNLKMQFHFATESFATYDDTVYNSPKECIYSLFFEKNNDYLLKTIKLYNNVFDDEIRCNLIDIKDVPYLLKSGKPIEEIFDKIDEFHGGFAVVKLNDKFNFIKDDRKLLFQNQWFDGCREFNNGLARIMLNNKYNFTNTEGNLLFRNKWADFCDNFQNGISRFMLNNRWNFINIKGEFLCENQWFDSCETFCDGFAIVSLNNKYNYINIHGQILLPNQWFDGCKQFHNGVAIIKLNNKQNFIKKDGKLLSSNQWFDSCNDFRNDFAIVFLDKKWNFINIKGELLSPNQWFDYCQDFYNGFAKVWINNKYNYIDTTGRMCDKDWNPIKLSETKIKKKMVVTESQLLHIKQIKYNK